MNCSAIAFVRAAWPVCLAISMLLVVAAPIPAETLGQLADAEARLQYAFLTADMRAVEQVLEEIEHYTPAESVAPLKAYQLAYGHWTLAQLHAQAVRDGRRESAGMGTKAARRCVQHARTARMLNPRMAEAYALEAVCNGMPRSFLRLGALRGSCSRSRLLRTALSLEPQNPRVLLIDAMCNTSADEAANLARWHGVVEAFGQRLSRSGIPGWGEPEALVMLGEHHLRRGELLAAREAIERALLLAPDYRAARELIEALAARSQ